MTTFRTQPVAEGRVDAELRLTRATGVLGELQKRCGGAEGGPLAVPELRVLTRAALDHRKKLARSFDAFDGERRIQSFVELIPEEDGEGCGIKVLSWNATEAADEGAEQATRREQALLEAISEATIRLDPQQRVIDVQTAATDLQQFRDDLEPGKTWTDAIAVAGGAAGHAFHWRLLDDAEFTVPGSDRTWKAHIRPLGTNEPGSAGFVVDMTSRDAPPVDIEASETTAALPALGRDLSPILRQPINRIVANAETIRAKLAGPLAKEYSDYAGDIATAGQHLLSLLDDVADLEVVESDDFVTAPDRIDLGDVARQACGILNMRAQERGIRLAPPPEGESQLAIAEFRRVLQILLNLVNNAIRYTPEGSQVWVRLDRIGQRATVTVADQGRGIAANQQAKVFEKFERLGRSGDGGSGLGLYISRRIARAMDGDLTLESAPGQGARFTLSVPAAEDMREAAR